MKSKNIIIITILIFIYAWIGETVWLESQAIENHLPRYVVAKGLEFFFCFFWIKTVLQMLNEWKEESKYKNLILYYWGGVLICIIFQMLTYPGCWGNDTITILEYTRKLEYLSFQHYLSTYFYFIGCSLFPFCNEFGIVFLQINVIAFIIAWILNDLNFHQYKYGKYSVLLLIPSMMFCFLFPIRCIWFGCALLILTQLFYKINLHYEKTGCIRKKYIYYASPIVVFATIIRRESFYIILVWILYLLYFMIKQRIKDCNSLIVNILICIGAVFLFQIPQEYDNENKSTAFLTPLSTLVAEEGLKYTESEYEAVNKIINVESLKKYSSYTDMRIAWMDKSGAWNRDFTDGEWHDFVKAYMNIVLKNPGIFLKYRLKTFWATSGLDPSFLAWGIPIQDRELPGFKLMVYGLENSENLLCRMYYAIAWNTVIPSIIILLGIIYSIIKKKLWMFIMLLIGAGELILIFLTVTSSQFMFHFPFVVCGYLDLLIILAELKQKRIEKGAYE